MRPRRTPTTDRVLRLPGGNEDNDLWVRTLVEAGTGRPMIESVWSLDDDERRMIADGANVVLCTWGNVHPPVALYLTLEQPGRRA